MSKANQRRLECLHEASHAVMAWIEGVRITLMKLVPEHEGGEYSATTGHICPAPEAWTLNDMVAHMRITLAGPQGEMLGPLPGTGSERAFAKREEIEHLLKAVQYAKRFGGGSLKNDEIALVESARQDVIEALRQTPVARCFRELAAELQRRGTIAGPEVEDFIADRISEGERSRVRKECCLTRGERAELGGASGR